MKRNNTEQLSKIEKINLILKKFILNDLSETEKNILDAQMKESDKLGYLLFLFKKISSSVALESKDELTANPAIKNNLRKRIKARAEKKHVGSKASLHGFFQVRIPLYQAVIAIFAVMILFTTINLPQSKNDTSVIRLSQTSQIERSIIDSLRIMQNLQMVKEQKVGWSIQEDTLLIRFITTSVDLF